MGCNFFLHVNLDLHTRNTEGGLPWESWGLFFGFWPVKIKMFWPHVFFNNHTFAMLRKRAPCMVWSQRRTKPGLVFAGMTTNSSATLNPRLILLLTDCVPFIPFPWTHQTYISVLSRPKAALNDQSYGWVPAFQDKLVKTCVTCTESITVLCRGKYAKLSYVAVCRSVYSSTLDNGKKKKMYQLIVVVITILLFVKYNVYLCKHKYTVCNGSTCMIHPCPFVFGRHVLWSSVVEINLNFHDV